MHDDPAGQRRCTAPAPTHGRWRRTRPVGEGARAMAYEWHRPLEAKMDLLRRSPSMIAVAVGGLVLLIPPVLPPGHHRAHRRECEPYSAPWSSRGATSTSARAATPATASRSVPSRPRPIAMAPSRWPARASTSGPSCGAPGAPGRTWRALGGKYPDSWHWLHLDRAPAGTSSPARTCRDFAFLLESRAGPQPQFPSKLARCAPSGTSLHGRRDRERAADDARSPGRRRGRGVAPQRDGDRGERGTGAQRGRRHDRLSADAGPRDWTQQPVAAATWGGR